jgi:hypothetical protein
VAALTRESEAFMPRAWFAPAAQVFDDLDTDFLCDRAFHPAHAIPEPDDFLLLFDVHESTSEVESN